MEGGKPSQTAITAALFRASHLHVFEGPKIHEDTFALSLSGIGGPVELADFCALLERMRFPIRRASAYFAFRHRFSEERLQAALNRGVKQVVLLGAGLDSFALRNPQVVARVHFVEIDHPDTQRWKLARIAALGLATPRVHYVPVDFTTQSLEKELAAAGVDASKPAFIAWLGVSQYISEEASIQTLSLAARHAPGSEIVFDVILPVNEQPPEDRGLSRASEEASAARGEPWISYFVPEQLEPRLISLDFSRVTRVTRDAASVYYRGQPPDVQPLGAWQMIAATV